MASSLWGHRQTEDDEELKRKGLSALTGVAAKDALDNPDVKPADEIADFDEDMEVETDDAEVELPDDSLPEVELPDDAEDETPKMGVGEHSRMTVRSETGKRADEILHGGDDLFTKTMGLFGVSKEGAASALIHTAPFARQISKIDASREEKALERLRTGEYDDSDMKAIAEEAGLSYDLEDIGRATAGSMDPINEQRRFLAMTAEDELLKRAQTRGEASNEIERRGQTTWGKIASGTLENSGYVASFIYGSSIAGGLGIGMTAAEGAGKLAQIGVGAVNTMIGSAPVSAVGAVERYERLSGKDYQVGENGELQVIDNNYGELRSALQGGIGGFVENTVVEGLTDTAIELGCLGLSKIPGAQAFIVKPLQRLGNAAVRKMMGNKAGRALLQVGKAYNGISQFTHFHSQPVEMLEEDLQPIFDNVFGLDKKSGEYKGFGAEAKEYWNKTLTWANQKDIFYGLVGTCLLQAGAGGAGAAWAKRAQPGATTAKEATSVLTDYANVPKEKVATLSDEEKIALCELYRTMSANPDKMLEFAEQLDAKAGTIMEEVVNRAGAKMNRRLEAAGMSPSTFKIPMREENGKNVPDFQFTIATDMVTGKTYKGRAVTDAESGVVIMENGSGVGTERAYTVIDPLTKQSVDVPNLMLARKAASLFKNMAAMTKIDRAAKQQYINNVWQQKYGNANIEQYDTVQQAIAASGRHGVDITAQEGFNPSRPAWHLNDGTIIFVRDNIQSPYEVDTLFQHEIIGHHAEAMADEFMDNLDSKSMREAQETLGLTDEQMADPRTRREVFANLIQQRRHNPSFMQKFKHFIHEKMGGKKISDADIEVLAQRWEQAAMGESGNMKSESAGTEMEFLDADGNAVGIEDAEIEVEEGETADETGRGADETQAQPAEGTERPAEPETPPAEAGAETGESEDVVKKPVASRTVIEKMTEQAPVQELPVSEVFNDDTRIPNFKEGANPETGEVEPLQGEPYDLVSNPIVVMEFKDGKKVVVTGRHRLALYKRAGREKIAARVIREADGWTVQDAKMIDSIGNIIDEKGSVKDYVKYFEDARPSREAAEAGGFLARPKGKLAFGIYEGATEDTRSAIDWEGGGADGMISVEQAGIIAEAAPRNGNPRNKALQRILVKKALDGLRGKKLGILARSLAEEVKNQKEPASAGGEMQLDLFSSPEDQALLAMEDKRAEYRTRKSQEYGRIAEVLRTAMAKGGKLDLNDEYARELGITDPKDRNQLAAARDKAVERANYWENAVRLDEADKTAMDAEIGASAKKTETKKTEVSERLKAIKEKKPKPKAETPAPEPPKTASASAPQQTEVKTPPKAEKPVEGQKSSDTGASNGSVTPQQADAFAGWRLNNPNAKVHSVFLRNDGTVSFGYEDGSGVARSAYLYANGERSNATPVHIAWKNFDEIHGKNAVRISEGDLGTKKADLGTKKADLETKSPKSETKTPKTETTAPKTETPVVQENRTTEKTSQVATPRKKTVVLKDAERAKAAQSQANDLMNLFATPELDPKQARATEVANALEDSESEANAVRKNKPPKKTKRTFKLFRKFADGTYGALFIDSANRLVSGEWYYARSPEIGKLKQLEGAQRDDKFKWGKVYLLDADNNATPINKMPNVGAINAATADGKRYMAVTFGAKGQKLFYNLGINGSGSVAGFAFRPGWHSTNAPSAGHIGPSYGMKGKVAATGQNHYRSSDQVWCEIEIPDDIDYNPSAMARAPFLKEKGRELEKNLKEAQLDYIPFGGSYFYRTNSNADEKQDWVISGAVRIVRELSREEVNRYNRENGFTPDAPIADTKAQAAEKQNATPSDVYWASPEFDPEKFQKRVGAMAKLVSTLNQEGYNDFKSIASYLSENFPKDRFDAAKPYLRSVWNAVADAMGLEEVSKKDAEGVYSEIEKSYNTTPNEETTNEIGLEQPGRTDDGQHPASSGESPEGTHSAAQEGGTDEHGSETGEVGNGTAVHDGGDGSRQGHAVERPEVADGAVSAGGAENIGNGADGSAEVAGNHGRDAQAGGQGVEGSESGVQLGSRESGGVDGGVAAPVRAALNEQAPNAVKNENYIITDADERAIEGGKPKDKVRANIAAIRIVRKLAEDGRDATPEEKTALARYVGWGGLKPAFNNTYYNAYEREQSEGTLPPQTWAAIRKTPLGEEGYDLYKQMRELLSQDEIKSIEESTTSAFFTPIRLCRSIHRALAAAGLTDGRLLETSAGIGNFIGTGSYTNPRWTAVELDKVTGQILKALYPKANVRIQGFEDVIMPDNFMDAAISNVPFGTNHPFDPNYKKFNFLVHDFFFAKAIDKIHPGGVAALITATGTLDKRDKSLIRYLSEHGGKIVGAVRIPNGFFAKNAGTDVATDVVFIQKVNGTADNSVFLETAEYKGCPVSKYFLDHPELCMGKMVPGTNQFAQPELSYKAVDDDYSKIDEAIQKAAEGLEYKSVNELEAPAPTVLPGFHNGLQNGNIGVVFHEGNHRIVRQIDGELQEVPANEIPGLSKPLLKKLVTPYKIVQGIESLRNAFRALVDGQLNNCTDEELKKLQDALNYEYSTFTARYGALNSPLMQKFIRLDYAAAPLLLGMENVTTVDDGVDSKGNRRTHKEFSRADIFTKRTIFAKPKATNAGSVLDGLRISLNELGTVSTARIAELTGKSEDDVKKELLETGLVFVNPETSGIETRDEYLSGSVRKKLKAARAAAEIDPSFKKNVDALEQVQPDDIAATDISYQLGQNWIPRDIYEQFFKEAIYQNTAPRLTVVFDPREHLWHVDTRGHGQTEYDEESGLSIEDLLERTMNGRSIVVRRRISENEYVVDQQATTATKIVQEKIARAFQSWMTDDTDRAERVERLYNDIMNDCVPRQYDTDVLEFYGLSKEWADRVGTKGRKYQKRCIARGTFGGNLLIAHCVGAGKTFEMASICMQLRRLGIARKPMFAVPNHMLAQWNREFHEAYPGAKVLVADKKDLTKQNRRVFLARAANGDWDCIIVAHSSFSRISMSPEHQAEYIEAELKDLNDLLFRVQSEKEKTKIRKKIQSLRDKLKSLLDPSKKDDAIKFEELGCDYLFVDEAHNFKGIQINTHMSNVPGVTGSVSQRAQDLEMKCRYIAKMHGGDKGVVFATGTPISNSISEMYVMMRYLAPSKMDEMGVRSFDDWAKQFGQVVNEWSPNPSGVGFREKARFSQFQNVPEMKRFFRSFSDIVLDSELKIKRPYMIGGKPIQHVLKPSAAQIAYVQELNRRMERMQSSKLDPAVDNMLKVTTEGRLLAIDPALIGVKDDSHTRANACADEVKRIYDKSTGKTVTGRDGRQMQINGTQLIFCDSGVPKKKQFKQLVRTAGGNYQLASGYWTFTVTAPDAYGLRQLYAERTDGAKLSFSAVADHSVEGREDLASVYTALEALQAQAERLNAESKTGKGTKKAKKPAGTPVDINAWLDLNSDAIGYDPRFSNPYAVEEEAETTDEDAENDAADDKDMSEEANGDVEVDNMLRGKFNMYAELRKQLIRRGIPGEEIAFIHDAETMTQKQALFDRVKRGEIRILIGNTAKMGEGTNVQDRLVAIHHLDIPWKPAWITQRDGRGIRSGNLNDEIGIHTYITEGTFDVYSWDTVGRKAKFIENAMNSRMDQRTIEDVDSTVMSLEEGKAAAAGDPRILERVKLIKAIEKEQMAFDTQAKALDRAQMRLRVAERDFDEAEKKIARRREIVNNYNAAKGDKPFTLTTIEDEPRAITDNDALARYIQDRLGFFARKGSEAGLVGQLFGLDVRYERGQNREGVMSINELGVHFPVTVLPGTGAAFPPSDLSKFKAAVTRETGQKALDYLDDYMATYKRGADVARRGVENAAGFDRDAAAAKIGDMNLRLAHLNRALGIKDQNVRDIAASYLRERRGQEEGNVAAAIAAAAPVEDNSVFADVPMDARLRVAEQQMAEADFASPEFDPRRKRGIRIPRDEYARLASRVTENDARFYRAGIEPLPWGVAHTFEYGYAYDRFSDSTFSVKRRWKLSGKNAMLFDQIQRSFDDEANRTTEEFTRRNEERRSRQGDNGDNSLGTGNRTSAAGNGELDSLPHQDLRRLSERGVDLQGPVDNPGEVPDTGREGGVGAAFASPELDPAARRLGIAKADLERQARKLGRVPWRPKKKTWAEVYQRSEAVLNQTGFIEELVEDAARYARPLSAEHTIAVGQHLLVLGKQYEEIRALRQDVEYSIVEASRENATTEDLASLNETLNQVKREESEMSKRYATAFKAMRMSKAEQGRSLAANRALFSEEFDFLGMKEVRQTVLGRELTPEEMRQLHDICDRARDLDEDARAELWAAVHAQAERTIKDIFMGDSVKRSGDSRKKKLTDYRKKYLDAMAHLKVWRDTVGGSLIGITGDEYGTWNRPLFDILLWHRFQNPDITAAEALQKVTEDVNTYVTADEQTVARILTGFERSWDINRHDDVLRGGRDLRSQILTQLQIGKLLNKEMPGKTGPIPGEPSAELREARHTRDVLKSELEDETNDPRKLQGRQKRWLKWYDNRIEDLKREIAAGERLPQTKRTLAWTEEMKQKRAEYEELVKERDRVCGKSGLSEEERIKRYEAQLERTLRRATDRLLAARNDDFRRPDRPAAVTSAYIEDLKKAIEETHKEWLQEKKDRLMFGRTQAEINKFNAKREKTRRDRIAYWQALTAPNADRSVVKKPQIPMPPEQQARYEELGQQMKRLRRQVMDMRAHDELMKKPWLWRHGVEYMRFVNGLTRGFLATADHSAVFRQMAQLSLGHPKLAAQVFKNTIGTAFSDEKATRINAELLSDPRIKEAVDKGWLNWRNTEAEGNSGDVEMFSSLHSSAITIGRNADGTEKRLALDDIKGVGAILRGSERIYATYINALSAEIYLALTNADGFTARLMFGQNGLTDYTKKEIAARINMANGSAQIDNGKRKQFMNQLTGIFWAPKLALSRLQLAVGWDVIHPLLDTSADVKTRLRTAGFNAIEHARSKLAMIALGTLMLMLAGDDDDKEKLRRSKWYQQFLQVIKPRIGDTTLDFSGGEVGWYQLMAKWATLQKETGTGKKVYFTNQDGHKQSFGADIMNDTFRFAQGKFNPLLSNAISLWTGKDYVGQPFGFGDLAINTFVPLGAADITKAFAENGLGRGLLLAPFVMFGAGGNTYPLKRYEIAANQFTEVAKSYDAVRDSGDLSDDERSDMMEEIEGNFPELKQRGRIEGAIGKVKFFQSEIKKAQKVGAPVPPALTDGLEQAKSEALEYIREARKPVDSSR